MDARTSLLELLATHAYQWSAEPRFLLASGAVSQEYLDCKMALSLAPAMAALGSVFHGRLAPGVAAIGGLTMGSDPIAMSTCQWSATTTREVRWFSVRKDAKGHGRKKRVEGNVREGDEVTVVDDVVTSGGSTIQAIDACRDAGLIVRQVLVLVDREQDDGMAKVAERAGCTVEAIFTKREIKATWERLDAASRRSG